MPCSLFKETCRGMTRVPEIVLLLSLQQLQQITSMAMALPVSVATVVSTLLEENYEDSDDDDIFVLSNIVSLRRQTVPKVLRFAEDIVPTYSSRDFREDFRVSRAVFTLLVDRLEAQLIYNNIHGKPGTAPCKQILVYLWFISNKDSIRQIARLFGLSKSTVHRCIDRVAWSICQNISDYIKWPKHTEQVAIAQSVEQRSHIPKCIGFIDGTHIPLAKVPNKDQDYVNRKGYPSLQLQLITDDQLVLRDVYVGWPGCAHDARVYRNSPIADSLRRRNTLVIPDGFLLGDSAYPLSSTLLAPFKDTGRTTPEQRYFNKKVSSERQVVERAIGHLKGRFRKLQRLDMEDPKDMCYLIVSACALHNLCVIAQDDIESFIDVQAPYNLNPNNYPGIFQNAGDGAAKRQQIVTYLQQFI